MDITVRRVVTSETRDGKGVFSHIDEVTPIEVGGGIQRFLTWGWDETPTLPVHNPDPVVSRQLPKGFPGKVRIETFVLPVGFPNVGSHPYAQGMHATDTVDIAFVIDGAICLRLDSDDREVTLRPGDVLIQHGAVHSWRNPFDKPCVMSYVFFGAERQSGPGQGLY